MAEPLRMASGKTMPLVYRWYALALLMLVAVFNYVDRLSLFILQVEIKEDLHLSDTQLGALTGVAFSVVYVLLGIPVARLADRTSRNGIIALALAIWSALTMACGLATGFAWLVVLRMGVAVGEAGSLPASHALVSDFFSRHQRATALAIWSLSIPIGQMLAFGLGGWLGEAYGWRGAFIALGAAGMIIAPLVLFTLREPLRGALDGPTALAPGSSSLREAIGILWRFRALRHILIGAALNCYVIYVVINWNAPFYNRVHGLSMGEIGARLALVSGLGTGLGMLVGGFVADRLGAKDARWRMWVPCIGAIGFAPLVVAQYFEADLFRSLALGVAAFMLGHAFYAPTIACVQSLAPPHLRAFAASILILAFNIVGMSLGPLFTGMISDYLVVRHGMATDSLRYAISASAVLSLWAAFHFFRAASHLPDEMERAHRDTVAPRVNAAALGAAP